jgi:hypothetical protein
MIAPAELKRPTEFRFIPFLLSLCDLPLCPSEGGQLLERLQCLQQSLGRSCDEVTNNTVSLGVLVRIEFNCLQQAIPPRAAEYSRPDAFCRSGNKIGALPV